MIIDFKIKMNQPIYWNYLPEYTENEIKTKIKTNNNNNNILQWDFNIHTDHLISARDLIIINDKKREFLKLSTLLSQLATEKSWKNVKRRISTSNLLENWKNYGTSRWPLYQLWLVFLAQ